MRFAVALVIGVGLLAAASGCGTKFELPDQTPQQVTPGEDTYFVKFRWAGFAGARDVFMTRGGQIFIAEPRPGAADSLRVRIYQRSKVDPTPTGVELPSLGRPIRIAEGDRGAIFVLDDVAPPSVKQFTADGRFLVGSFSDPVWSEIVADTSRVGGSIERVTSSEIVMRGLAADRDNSVYVAWTDTTFYLDRDLLDTTRVDTTRTFVVSHSIIKYTADGIPLETIASEGSGAGFVDGPGGLEASVDGLLFADVNKNWVQLVDSDEPSTPLLLLNGLNVPGDPQFLMPFDVAGDDSGSIYVADTGKRRVLRFDSDGAFVQRVDLAADGVTGLAVDPIALTANTQLVYILDAMLGEILVFELRSTLEDTQ
jgi:hypothetical protein